MGQTIHDILTHDGTLAITLVFAVPIFGIIGGTIIVVTKSLIRHRERMAMIEQGIHPDSLAAEEESKTPAPH